MIDLQSVFYVVGIVYMVLGVVILVAMIAGIFIVFKVISDVRRKIEEKIKCVERVVKHPEDVIADMGASLIRSGLQGMKEVFNKRKKNNSTE